MINIPDKKLKEEIKENLGITEEINLDDMLKLKEIKSFYYINDLTGLEYAKNLKKLNLTYDRIEDLTVIENLSNLTHLKLNGSKVKDFTPISNLKKLKKLVIRECQGKFFLPRDNETRVPYFNLIYKIYPFKNFTDLEKKKLEDFLMDPTEETALEAINKSAKNLFFVRSFLSEAKIKKLIEEKISGNDFSINFYKQLSEYKPLGDETDEVIEKTVGKGCRKYLKKKKMEEKLKINI